MYNGCMLVEHGRKGPRPKKRLPLVNTKINNNTKSSPDGAKAN